MSNFRALASVVYENGAFTQTDGGTDGRTDGRTDRVKSTQLVELIQNIYTLWGLPCFLLPVTYIFTKTLYPDFPFSMGSGYKKQKDNI